MRKRNVLLGIVAVLILAAIVPSPYRLWLVWGLIIPASAWRYAEYYRRSREAESRRIEIDCMAKVSWTWAGVLVIAAVLVFIGGWEVGLYYNLPWWGILLASVISSTVFILLANFLTQTADRRNEDSNHPNPKPARC